MSKRSDFKRIEKDFYPTIDKAAITPLIPHLKREGIETYAEPCVGDGHLVDLLSPHLDCTWRSDIEPRQGIKHVDGRNIQAEWLEGIDAIITNPPWSIPLLHDLIANFASIKPTWLLFYADWMHTKRSAPFMTICSDVVPVGRLQWIPDTKMKGKDNVAWYRFDDTHKGGTVFHPWQVAA